MADNIQRVGLELTADGAKDFASSLKQVSAATKEAYSELKLAQSQYDKNTSATKKLEDRQKYLTTAVEEYTKKEAILKGQLEEMEGAENRDEAAISKKKREINECEAKLNGYKSALKDVTTQIQTHSAQLKEWGEKLKDVGGQMKSVGDGMTKYVTAPIAAAGAASAVAWKEVDAAMDIVTKKTGATGEALTDMHERAQNLATSMPTSFETAASAVGEVNTRFGVTGEELETLSAEFIKFAQINDTDVSTSVDNVQSLMAAWGVSMDETTGVLDLLTKAGQDSGTSIDTLATSLRTNQVALSEMGLSLDQSVDLLANCEKNGLDATTMLAGMKKALQKSTKEGKSSSEAMAELQEALKGAESDTEAMQLATELFGSKAGPAIAAACRDGRLNFEELGYSMEDLAGITDQTFEDIKSPMDEMQPVINSLKETGYDIVQSLGPVIVDLLTHLADGARSLNEWWNSLSEGQQQMILQLAGLAAVMGPVISVVGTLATGIGGLVTTIGGVIASGGGFMAVLTAVISPVGLVVAAIAALIAIGILLYQNWDTIKEKCAALKDAVIEKWENLKESVKTKIDNLKTAAIEKWEGIKETVKGKVDDLKSAVIEKWEDLKEKVKGKVDDIKTALATKWEGIKTTVKEKVEGVWSTVTGKFEDIRSGIEEKINNAKQAVSDAIDKIKGFFNFSWSLPHLKMPHPYISGSFSLNPPSVPHFGIDWYGKAMGQAYMLTDATIFGAAGGRALGGGERGNEIVMGEDYFAKVLADALKAVGAGDRIVINVYASPGMDEEYLAEVVQKRLVLWERQRRAAYV